MLKNILKININSNRIYGLDILRCMAILFVVIEHGNFLLPDTITNFTQFIVFDGVSIFFVLSGFLIGGILIKEFEKRRFSFSLLFSFWLRRWFRTLPNYFLILIILCILHVAFTENFTLSSVGNYFIFSQNLLEPHPAWFFPEAWSLSTEEWFYLLIPILILLIGFIPNLSKKKAIIYTAFSIIISITIFRFIRYYNIPINNYQEWDLIFRKQVFTRLDSIMFGVVGSYISFYYKNIWIRHKGILLLFGVATLVLSKVINLSHNNDLYFCVFSFSITSIGTLLLLPYLSEFKKSSGSIFSVVTYFSLISYSMYLINLSIVRVWIISNLNFVSLNNISGIISGYFLFWFLTIFLSIIIYKYYEIPMTRLRDKIKFNIK